MNSTIAVIQNQQTGWPVFLDLLIEYIQLIKLILFLWSKPSPSPEYESDLLCQRRIAII